MNHAAEITHALRNVPNEISFIALTDINKRISDWIASGGDPESPYILQQVRYARNIEKRFGQQKKPLTAISD